MGMKTKAALLGIAVGSSATVIALGLWIWYMFGIKK